MSHHYIQFKNVSFSYPRGPQVLHDVNFRINHGEHVALMGLNGSGKSTLLLHVNGLLMPSSGEVVIGDIPVTRKTLPIIRQTVGMVFQNADDMLFMPTVGDDVAFGPRNMGLPDAEVSRRVGQALCDVGMEEVKDRPSFSLSGGQRKAVSIASVLSMEPSILVLDEPSASLDSRARGHLVRILKQFRHTILLATHDTALAEEICDRTITLEHGRIVEDRTINNDNY